MFDSLSDTAINCLWSKRPDIASLYTANGWQTGTAAQKRAVLANWWSMTTETKPASPSAWAQQLGCMAVGGGTVTPDGPAPSNSSIMSYVNQGIAWAKANPLPAAAIAYFLFLRRR